jgi:hypothetical protein
LLPFIVTTSLAVVLLTGPVVIPAPAPASASLLVTVVAVAAIGTCPAVIPDKPELVAHTELDAVQMRAYPPLFSFTSAFPLESAA